MSEVAKRLVAGVLVVLAGCAGTGNEDVRGLEGTVVREGNRYMIVADSGGIRFVPDRMPNSYREEGLRVLVRGRSRPIDGGIDTLIRHLELTSLAELNE